MYYLENEEPQLLAVNSYDNIIRIYDRAHSNPMASYNLLYTLKGYINKNWPIKSSFFHRMDGALHIYNSRNVL